MMRIISRLVLVILLSGGTLFAHATKRGCEPELQTSSSTENLKNRLYREFLYQSSIFLGEQLRWPDPTESENILASAKAGLRTEDEEVNASLDELDLDDLKMLLASAMNDLQKWFPNQYLFLRRKVAAGYVRAVRQTDLEKRFRTVPTTPSTELIFLGLLKAKNNGGPKLLVDYLNGGWSIEHLRDLFMENRRSVRTGTFPQPLIFPDGVDELERAARFDAPAAFATFVDTRRIVTDQRAQNTVLALERAKGFIAVSWTSGKPLAKDYLDSLIALAERKDWVILIGPTQQNFEGLPEIFLNHPRIHVVTHTIENAALKISNEPINPDIENPLSEVKKAGRYKPGQTVVVFHPHQILEPVPTGSNGSAPVMVVSTGSINESFAPYSSASQGRRRQANKVFHKQKAWIFEKGDALSRFDADGAQDIWHMRPITYYDDRQFDGTSGIIDLSTAYQFRYLPSGERRFEVVPVDPEVLYLGDPHDPVTDPSLVQSLVEDLGFPPDTHVAFQGGDTFDFSSLSHWSTDKMVEMNQKFRRDELSVIKQVNGVIQLINALLQRFPNARYRQIVGNHDEWLTKVLEATPDVQRVINGDFLDELNFAVKTLNLNIWDYIFKHREKILSTLLISHPDKRTEILRRILPIFDADRIDILNRGVPLLVGPEHRKNDVGRHGDRTSFGKKTSTLKEHAKAMPEGGGVTGHTHRLGIYGEVVDAGTLGPIEADYARGFNSASGQGIAPVYPNGTKQLLIFNRRAGTFRQRSPDNVLPPAKFFSSRLTVVPNDNSQISESDAHQAIWLELGRLKAKLNP